MRRYIRANTPGATYFFTVALEDRRSNLLLDQVDLLRHCVAEVRAKHPFRIDAMVVLPDHLHALWTMPVDDADFARRWMLVKQSFTKHLTKSGALPSKAREARGAKGERSVWQRRYWEHQIRDERDFAAHVDYIHFNPVKHGLVARAAEWPYSSFHRFVRDGRLGPDWGVRAEVRVPSARE